MINATTNVFAVIGDPIAHSLSPVMHNRWIQELGLNAVYMAFHVKNENLSDCVAGMRALNIRGLNVTVPHKEAVLPFVDHVSDEVQALKAANTLKLENDNVSAHVTDPYGFMESVFPYKGRFEDATVLLFGAGGAARSVVFACSKLGVGRMILHDLFPEKVESLQNAAQSFGLENVTSLSALNAPVNDIIAESDVLINATALGMHPHVDKSVIEDFSAVSRKHLVYDLVYNPGVTRFLHESVKRSATVKNGLDMLLFQGLQSLRIWMDEHFELSDQQLETVRKIMNNELGIDG